MKKTNTALKNILTLLLLSLLTLAMVWLGWQQTQRPTATGQQETNTPPPPSPTKTVPIFMGRIKVVTYTLGPPTATPTSTPIPAVQVISDEKLFDESLLPSINAVPSDRIYIRAWYPNNELLVDVDTGSTEQNTWLYNINTQTVQPTADWEETHLSREIIADIEQFGVRINTISISPNVQWSIGGSNENFLIRKIGSADAPIDILQGVQFERIQSGNTVAAWTEQSDLVAYVIHNAPKYRHEIRITDPVSLETNVSIIQTYFHNVIYDLSWSPDGQYLAFEVREEQNTQRYNIYLIRRDGSGLTKLTTHEHGFGPITWDPNSNRLIYHYQQDYLLSDGRIGAGYYPHLLIYNPMQE